MPVTACFACIVFVSMILFIPVLPISLILLDLGRRRAAITLAGISIATIGLSALFTLAVLVMMWHYGMRMSRDPDRLFKDTLGFWPPAGTEVLEAYCELGMEWEHRALKFRAPPAVIEKICAETFTSRDKEAFVSAYGGDRNNLPDRVASWFLPGVEQADQFYIAKPFNRCSPTDTEAILCYSEKTRLACFYWTDVYY